MLRLFAEELWDSPFVFSVLVALEEKGLSYEVEVLHLKRGEHRREPFRSRSITARVPALEHDGFLLTESLAILEYLEESFPAPAHRAVLPAGVQERARARQVLGWLRSDLMNLRRERSTEMMFLGQEREPLSASGQADVARLVEITERFLGGRASLFDEWCIADADLAFMLARLRLNGDPLPATLERYVDACFARPSVRVYLDKPRPGSASPK